MRPLITSFGLLVLCPLVAIPAYGAEPGSFYLGVSTGETQWVGGEAQSLDADEGVNSFAPGQTFGQATDSSQLTIGYQINRALGFELRYADYGVAQQSFAIRDDITFILAPVNAQAFEAQDVTLLVTLGHQFITSGVSLFAEAGISRVRFDSTISRPGGADAFPPPPGGSLISLYDYSQHWGGGAEYAVTHDIVVQLYWQHRGFEGMELESSTLGVQFGF